MNLVIDVGNTLVKLAVFDSGILKHKKTCVKTDFLATLGEFFENFPSIDNSIVSSVAHFSEQQISKLEKLCNVLLLDHTTTVPFINKYGTPKTLGIDRIALASAAVHLYINKNVLVIDAGTCITYDFINSFPLAISSMPVSYDGSSLLKCTVSMSYIRYVVRNLYRQNAYPPSNPFQQSEFNAGGFLGNLGGSLVDSVVDRVTGSDLIGDVAGGLVNRAIRDAF